MRKGIVFAVIALVVAMGFGIGKPAAAADDRDTCKTAAGDTAIEACTRAIASKKYRSRKQRTTRSLIYTNRGVEYARKKEYDKAIADHDKAIKLDPKNAPAYNNRGNVHSAMGDYGMAVDDFDMALKLKPDFAEALFNRGLAKRGKGDWKAGDEDMAKARQLQPTVGTAK